MNEGVVTIAYLIAGVLFIRSLGGLSKQETAGLGNLFGMVGMAIAVVVTAVVWSGSGGSTLTVGPLGLGGDRVRPGRGAAVRDDGRFPSE